MYIDPNGKEKCEVQIGVRFGYDIGMDSESNRISMYRDNTLGTNEKDTEYRTLSFKINIADNLKQKALWAVAKQSIKLIGKIEKYSNRAKKGIEKLTGWYHFSKQTINGQLANTIRKEGYDDTYPGLGDMRHDLGKVKDELGLDETEYQALISLLIRAAYDYHVQLKKFGFQDSGYIGIVVDGKYYSFEELKESKESEKKDDNGLFKADN